MNRYHDERDLSYCRRLHREYGKTYYYSTLRFPADVKWRVHGLYGFVRVADEWIDNPGSLSLAEQKAKLEEWRTMMNDGMAGIRPDHPAMRVFCDAARQTGMPMSEAHAFLDAMAMDLTKARYADYDELREYMRGSASAVGVMMCSMMGSPMDEDTMDRAMALGEAMQMTNFLRDIGEDFWRGRIYMPLEDLARFNVTEEDIAAGRITEGFLDLMRFEIDRTRRIYEYADPGIARLPAEVRKAVLLARILYSRILDRIEANSYDVFRYRARTSFAEKSHWAVRVATRSTHILEHLEVGQSHGCSVRSS